MRTLCVVIFTLFAAICHAHDYQAGDIVVFREGARITLDGNEVSIGFPTGMLLTVEKVGVNGRLLVHDELLNDDEPLGWISTDDVLPLGEAAGYLTKMIKQDPDDTVLLSARAEVYQAGGDIDLAIADYNDLIRIRPEFSIYYALRGNLFAAKKNYRKAIADFDVAVRNSPDDSLFLCGRASIWHTLQEYDKAISDCTAATRLNPNEYLAHHGLGLAWSEKKEYDKAIASYIEAIRIRPRFAQSRNSLAWLFATCPDEQYRDGNAALEHAIKAMEIVGKQDHTVIDSLAAAYAEVGDFETAVNYQKKALQLVPEDKRQDFAARLDLYKAGEPYRQR